MTGVTLVISRMKNLHTEIKQKFEEWGFTNVTVTGEEKDSLNCVINDLNPYREMSKSLYYKEIAYK